VEHVFTASTHDYMLFFTAKGRIYWKKVYEIPEGGRATRGKASSTCWKSGRRKDCRLHPGPGVPGDAVPGFRDLERRGEENQPVRVRQPRAGGIIAIKTEEGDILIGVKLTSGRTTSCSSPRRHEHPVRRNADARSGRTRSASRALSWRNGSRREHRVVEPNATLLAITENGYGKRTGFDE